MRHAVSSSEIPDFGGGRRQVVDGESRPEAVLTPKSLILTPDSWILTPVFTAPDPSDHSPPGTALQKMSKMKVHPAICMKTKGTRQNVHP